MASTVGLLVGGIIILAAVLLYFGGLGVVLAGFQFTPFILPLLQDLGATALLALGILVAVFL